MVQTFKAGGFLARVNIKTAALFVQFIVSVSFNLMGSFLPLFIETELNYPLIEATYWTGTAQFISSILFAICAPFWGFMCDKIGTKKIMMIAMAGNGVAYTGMAMSTHINHILILRGLQGSFGGISTVMFTLVATVVPRGELKKALSYQMAAMTMGNLVGPGIGGGLTSVLGYRLTFIISSLLFLTILPLISTLSIPPPVKVESDDSGFNFSDVRASLPDMVNLVLVYACMNFIMPIIPWFLESVGVPDDELLLYTTVTTTLNGVAFAVATPFLTRVVRDRALPILSVIAAGAILSTAFVKNPLQFIALRASIGAIQSGIPPNLLGGSRSKRRGTMMGFLNSARFVGIAIGPFIAINILGEGTQADILNVCATMAGISLLTAFVLYLTHRKPKEIQT